MANPEADGFSTDYAASSRSKCNRCRQPISEGELRVGPLVQSDKGDFKYPQWHHLPCFEDGWLKKHPDALTNISQIKGLDRLKFEDQKKLKSLVVGGDSTLETKPVTEDEKLIAKENKLVWARREKLDQLSNAELADMLEDNDQPNSGKIFGGRSKLLDRCADGMAFGALPKCGVCKNGDLYFSMGMYKCTGKIDEFARCEFKTTENVNRLPWKVSEELREAYDFLRTYKYTPRTKNTAILEAENPVAQENKRAREGDEGPTPSASQQTKSKSIGGPFAGCAITCCGKLSRTQKVLSQLVTENGGTFVTGVAAASICVTTALEASGNGSQKGKDAVKAKLLCVSEAWLDATIKNGSRLSHDDTKPFVLANPKAPDAKQEAMLAAGRKIDLEKEAAMQRAILEEKPQPDAKSNATDGRKKLVVKGGSAVDPDSELQENGHIYEPSPGEVYNQTMNLADVSTGQNSFYIIQIIESDNKTQWTVFRKWGKVGVDDIGGKKSTGYPMPGPAIREFKKVFLDKTGNDWEDRKKGFKKVYGKFMPIEMDYSVDESTEGAANLGDYNGKLDKSQQDFISLIFDIKMMKQTLIELEIDTEKMPLGKLSKTTIAEGFGTLKELQKVLEQSSDQVTEENKTRVVSLTNKFYSFIPHAAPLGVKLPLLDSLKIVGEKNALLTTLQDLEVASKILSQGGSVAEGAHPIDVNYKKLKTDMRTVKKGTDEWKMVNDYVNNTHATSHTAYHLELVDLFAVDREGEAERFKPFETNPNRQLLWHGSRLANWTGIISQGLRIAPPEAPSTGYMFGKGVYFADMVTKSANYCFTTSEKTTGVMMLCEVALGNMKERRSAFFEDKLPDKTYLSTKGVGRNAPNPKENFVMENGTIVPKGKQDPTGVKDTTLMYNEFIVYDVNQIRTRYVMRLNFNYSKKCGTFF